MRKRRSLILDIRGVLVSSEVVETFFCCDLNACKGACCIEGEGGAPVEEAEVPLILEAYPIIEQYLPSEQIAYIENKGLMYTDDDGDLVTNIVSGRQCVYTCYESNGAARCAFEKAYTEGKNRKFYKPISCHLYPIRVQRLGENLALNYHRWIPICEPARIKGRELGIRVYQFLKEPLIRMFGEEWYSELCRKAELEIENE